MRLLKPAVIPVAVALWGGLALSGPARASSSLPMSPEARVDRALGALRGTVTGLGCYRAPDGRIWTRATVRVDEALKGRLPRSVALHFRGGRLDDEGEACGLSPELAVGDERVFLLWREPDGRLTSLDGAAGAWPLARGRDGRLLPHAKRLIERARTRGRAAPAAPAEFIVEDSATYASGVTGLFTNSGSPSRFLAPDRGEPVPCYVDMQALPPGMSSNQALGALSNAFAAWSGTSSVQFAIVAITNFGVAAPVFATNVTDGRLNIQMHDLHNNINTPGVLGIGGRSFRIATPFTNGGFGGNVLGTEFFPTSRGYVVLEHTNSTLENADNLAEALCHEIGHALGLRHSSEDPSESDPLLADAMMYYSLHGAGRGATLGSYDPPIIEQAHPRTNTPPWTCDRVMDVVATTPQIHDFGFTEIEARGWDLQDDLLSLQITNATANRGAFSVASGRLRFTPSATTDLARIDPTNENTYWDLVYARSTDGTNGSPWIRVRLVSRLRDTLPASPPDGMPDAWMLANFGTANPGSDPRLAADGDFDGDGMRNLDEFRCGFNPRNSTNRLAVTAFSRSNIVWQARPYDAYEPQRSTNLLDWARHGVPQTPTNVVGQAAITAGLSEKAEFFRVQRVP